MEPTAVAGGALTGSDSLGSVLPDFDDSRGDVKCIRRTRPTGGSQSKHSTATLDIPVSFSQPSILELLLLEPIPR